MHFDQIPGNESIKRYLTELVETARLPHAMIFTGPMGNAKLALAIAFANYLQCSDKQNGESCGKCPACLKSMKYVHPDIHFVFPAISMDGKKREDTVSADFYPMWRSFIAEKTYGSLTDWLHHLGADSKPANINTKECSQISNTLGLKSYEGQYKILIIWHAEYLGKDGNRLLKLIEEPPENTIIILLTERTDKIIKTILSRCQIIGVPPFTDQEIKLGLEAESFDISEELVYLADGNLHLAKSLSAGNWENHSDELMTWMRTTYQMKPESIVKTVNELARKAKQEQINFLSYGLYYMKEYRNALISQDIQLAKLSESEKDVAIKMSNLIDESMSRSIVSLFEEGINHLRRNANAKILFMDLTVRLEQIMKHQNVLV